MKKVLTVLGVAIVLSFTAAMPVFAELTPANVEQFFVTPGEAASLTWTGATGSSMAYRVTDYWGKQVATGQAAVNTDGRVQVNVQLPAGFYQISFPQAKQAFGIDAITPFQGKTDPFFAIDSALSTRISPTSKQTQYKDFHAVRRELIEILKRSGVSLSRERLHWPEINPAEGKWNFDADHSYDRLRREYAKVGVSVLDMFETAPPYVGRVTPSADLPLDLVKTAAAWDHIADEFQQGWAALEVWNQPYRGNWPADQYVPLLKALCYAMHQRKKPVVVGTASMSLKPASFLNLAADNGLLDYTDFYNFHTYARAPKMQGTVQRHRDWLVSQGHGTLPIWLTECGRPWSRGTSRPDMAEDQVSALDINMKAVEARACGVARYFPFIYVYYGENGFNYGMMGKAATPLRSFAGYAAVIRILAHRPYLGDWRVDSKSGPKIKRARVFGGGDDAVVVFYTGEADQNAVLHTLLHPLKVLGIDGRALKVNVNGDIPIPDGLTYVVVRRDAVVGDNLKSDTTAMQLYKLGHGPLAKPAASPIVLQTLVGNQKQVRPTIEGYWYRPGEGDGKLTYSVRATNLGDRAYNLTLEPSYDFDSGEASSSQSPTKGKARSCQVRPHAFTQLSWTLDLPVEQSRATAIKAAVHARAEDGTAISPVVFQLLPDLSLKQLLARHEGAVQLPISDLKRWRRNAPRHTQTKRSIAKDGAWRLDVDFPAEVKDRWVYPKFRWPESINAAKGYKGFVIRERCDQPGSVRMFIWIKKKGGGRLGYLTVNKIIPADGQWHAAFVPFTAFRLVQGKNPEAKRGMDLSRINAISLGVHSGNNSPRNIVEVSDLWLVK